MQVCGAQVLGLKGMIASVYGMDVLIEKVSQSPFREGYDSRLNQAEDSGFRKGGAFREHVVITAEFP